MIQVAQLRWRPAAVLVLVLAGAGCTTGRQSLLATTASAPGATQPFEPAADAVVVAGPERADPGETVTVTDAGVRVDPGVTAVSASNLFYVSGNVVLPGAALPASGVAAGLALIAPPAGARLDVGLAARPGGPLVEDPSLGTTASASLQPDAPALAGAGPAGLAAPLPQASAAAQAGVSGSAETSLQAALAPPPAPALVAPGPPPPALSAPGQAVQFAGEAQALTPPAPSLSTPALPAAGAAAGAINALTPTLSPAATGVPGL